MRVTYAKSMTLKNQPNVFLGICIAKANKGLGSNFLLRNVVDGVAVELLFETYSPLVLVLDLLKSDLPGR